MESNILGLDDAILKTPLLSPHEDEKESNSNDQQISHHEEGIASTPPVARLTVPLRALFFVNGLTLALLATSLLYVVNTRVQMPAIWIPSYASVAFLPYSLKVGYAYVSCNLFWRMLRNRQIAFLLFCSGMSCIAVTQVNSIVSCFAVAFVVGFTTAWPEFLLGLTLLDQASVQRSRATPDVSFTATASSFQAQAATARSMGSFFGYFLIMLFLELIQVCSNRKKSPVLTDTTVNIMLVATGFVNCCGAFVAWFCLINHSSTTSSEDGIRVDQHEDETIGIHLTEESGLPSLQIPLIPIEDDEDNISNFHPTQPSTSTLTNQSDASQTARVSVLLQTTLILLTVPKPNHVLVVAAFWSLLLLVVVACSYFYTVYSISALFPWKRQYRVGLYLIIRNAIPSFSLLMSSYFYTIFKAEPWVLQLFSICEMVVATAACWIYELFWAKYSITHEKLMWLIAGTTALAAVVSLGNVGVIRFLDSQHNTGSLPIKIMITLVVKIMDGMASEWKFLPDIVLATISVDALLENSSNAESDRQANNNEQEANKKQLERSSLQYGSLISCIDFGGQIGALLAGPLVALAGTERENGWAHLDLLQVLNSTLMMGSILLLVLIR